MNENKSFLITLLLVVGSGVVIGLFAFGLTGKGGAPAAATNTAAPVIAPSPTPTTAPAADDPEPPPPVQDQPANDDPGKALPPPR
jgi:hypothetical protein